MQNPAVNPSTGSLARLVRKFPTHLTNTRQRLLRPVERRFPRQTFPSRRSRYGRAYVRTGRRATRPAECRVSELLGEPWDKEEGRPRELALREALIVILRIYAAEHHRGCMGRHLRRRRVNDIAVHHVPHAIGRVGDRRGRQAAEDAAEATRNAIALVDGTLWPCWSWDGESKL